jgi:hypothetical protein
MRRALSTLTVVGATFALGSFLAPTAEAANRPAVVVATSNGSGAVLLALGAAVLVLGGVGFVVFTYARRKRQPGRCDPQREALELAEKSVKYWEAARAHLEAVERERTASDESASDEPSHATLVANALNGLQAAMKQRDECQMDLIRCMASGVPAVPVIPNGPSPGQPFFTPESDGPTSSAPNSG